MWLRLLRLKDAVKQETVAIGDEFQARRVGIGCLVLGEKNVEIIELRPIQPECGRVWQWVFGREDELRRRWRCIVVGVDIVTLFGTNMLDSLQ